MMEILQEVGIHQDWMPMFQENPDLLTLLYASISQVEENLGDDQPMIPERSKLLLALSRCSPKDVKVVILGHDPIRDASLATGFAFSFPKGMFSDEKYKKDLEEALKTGQRNIPGSSLADLHYALVEAGYLERGANYDGCHEVWADRGVLLLNAALTYNYGKHHFPMWKDFVARLLFLVAKEVNKFSQQNQQNQQHPVLFLCWGTNAGTISDMLHDELMKCRYTVQKIDGMNDSNDVDGSARFVLFIGHHPTFPREKNNFRLQATNQFKAIKQCYPDLFHLPKLTTDQSPVEELANKFTGLQGQLPPGPALN